MKVIQVAAPVAERRRHLPAALVAAPVAAEAASRLLRPLPRQPLRRSQTRSRSLVQMMAAEAEVEARHPAAGQKAPRMQALNS